MSKQTEINVAPMCPNCGGCFLSIEDKPERHFKCVRCKKKYEIPKMKLKEITD